MNKTINITLTKEQYDILIKELNSLYMYHWNSDSIHADDCGSKVLDIIEEQQLSNNKRISLTSED